MSLPAFEGHRRARLHAFVTLARRRKRNFSLTVELEAAVLQRALHDHRAEHRDELRVGETVAVEGRCGLGGRRVVVGAHETCVLAPCRRQILRQRVPVPVRRETRAREPLGAGLYEPDSRDPRPSRPFRYDELVAYRRHLHAHPELSMEELETAAFVARELESCGSTKYAPASGRPACWRRCAAESPGR